MIRHIFDGILMPGPFSMIFRTRKKAWAAALRPALPAVLMLAVLLVWPIAATAQLPPARPADAGRLSPEDIQRFQRKQVMSKSHERIRELFSRGEFQAVITEIENAQKVDPNDAVLKMYRKWAEEKLLGSEAPTEKTPEVPRTVETSYSTGMVALPPAATTPTAAVERPIAPLPALTPVAPPPSATAASPVSTSPAQPQPAARSSVFRTLLLLMIVAGAVAIGWLALSKVLMRKKAAALPAKPDSASRPDYRPVSKPQPVSRPPTIAPESAPVSEADLAADIAHSIGSMSLASEPPPTFDIFIPTSAEGHADLEAFHESMPTRLLEHGEELPAEHPAEPSRPEAEPVRPATTGPSLSSSPAPPLQSSFPRLDDFLQPAEPKETLGLAPQLTKEPPASLPQARTPVSFEDLGIVIPAETQPPKPSGLSFAGKEPSLPGSMDDRIVLPHREREDDALSLPSGSDVTKPLPSVGVSPESLVPAAKPVGAINLDDLMLDTIAGFSDRKGPSQLPPSKRDLPIVSLASEAETIGIPPQAQASTPPPESDLGETASMALPSLDELRPLESSQPIIAAPQLSDTFHSGETIQLDMPVSLTSGLDLDLGETKTSGLPPKASLPALEVPPSPSAAATIASEPPSQQADERSERMFRDQYQKGSQAYQNRNWKQAVHYLSIAAAIHPENDEVRGLLRDAREQKRREEVGE